MFKRYAAFIFLGLGLLVGVDFAISIERLYAQQAVPTAPVASSPAQPISGTVSVGNDVTVQGDVADGTADSGNTVKTGGVYNATLPTLGGNTRSHLQLTQQGKVLNAKDSDYPSNPAPAVPVQSSSGIVANTTATATLAGVASKTTYLAGFNITGTGATAAGCIAITITGTFTNHSYVMCIPAGVTSAVTPLSVLFNPPIPASATNTSIVISAPGFGAGSTGQVVNTWGYQL